MHADARPKLAIAAEGPGLLILSATEARDALARAAPASTSWSARLPTPAPDARAAACLADNPLATGDANGPPAGHRDAGARCDPA